MEAAPGHHPVAGPGKPPEAAAAGLNPRTATSAALGAGQAPLAPVPYGIPGSVPGGVLGTSPCSTILSTRAPTRRGDSKGAGAWTTPAVDGPTD